MKIVRLVSFENFKSHILPEKDFGATLHLRDPRSYRDISLCSGGDSQEGEIRGKDFTATTLNNYLISCWSILENNDDVRTFSSLPQFKNRSDIAIVSDTTKIREVLIKRFPRERSSWIIFEKDQEVKYYHSQTLSRPLQGKEVVACNDAVFCKTFSYQEEKEYRFACRVQGSVEVERVAFYVEPKNYIIEAFVKESFRSQAQARFLRWGLKISSLFLL